MLKKFFEYAKMYRFRLSMIIVNAIIAVLPVILLGTLTISVGFSRNVESINSTTASSFKQINNHLDDYFKDIKQISKIIFFDDRVLNVLKNDPKLEDINNIHMLRNYFSSVMMLNPNMIDVYAITQDLRQVGTNDLALGEEIINIMDKSAFVKNEDEFSFIVPDTFIGRSNANIIARQKIRYKDTLQYAGIGAILLNKNDIMKSLDGITPISGTQIFVSDNDGKLIAATKGELFKVFDYLMEKNIAKSSFTEVFGDEYLINVGKIHSTGWNITAIVSADEIYKEIYWQKRTIGTIVILILLLSITATLYYNLSISKYIKSLTSAFSSVANERLNVRLDFGKGHEMAYISDGFNKMMDDIKKLTNDTVLAKQKLYELEVQKVKAEIYGLQSQINSHFLYNILSSIRGMARVGKLDAVDSMITGLASLLRYAMDRNEFVTLNEEIKNADNYIKLHNVSDRKIIFKSDTDKDSGECKVHRLLIQPVIENSIIHGFKNKQRGTIFIKTKCENGILTIKIFDDGCGIGNEQLKSLNKYLGRPEEIHSESKKYIGLLNIQKRIKISFGEDYGIFVKSWEKIGTLIVMNIPEKRDAENV